VVEEHREPIAYPLAIFAAFVGLVAAANALYGGPAAAAGTALLYVGGVAAVALALPLWLAARGKLALPVWPAPRSGDNAFAVLLLVFLFARVEALVVMFAEGRPWGLAVAVFLGSAALNLAAVMATVGVLLPALKRRMPAASAVALAALAFTLYHAAQFRSFAGAFTVETLVIAAVFGLGYSLYYFWSRSLFLTALLQHMVASTNLVYERDFGAGETGPVFYYSLAVLALFLIVVVAKRRLYGAERFTHF
jgi:membrane protease YdiL (CAAX protease family)